MTWRPSSSGLPFATCVPLFVMDTQLATQTKRFSPSSNVEPICVRNGSCADGPLTASRNSRAFAACRTGAGGKQSLGSRR